MCKIHLISLRMGGRLKRRKPLLIHSQISRDPWTLSLSEQTIMKIQGLLVFVRDREILFSQIFPQNQCVGYEKAKYLKSVAISICSGQKQLKRKQFMAQNKKHIAIIKQKHLQSKNNRTNSQAICCKNIYSEHIKMKEKKILLHLILFRPRIYSSC